MNLIFWVLLLSVGDTQAHFQINGQNCHSFQEGSGKIHGLIQCLDFIKSKKRQGMLTPKDLRTLKAIDVACRIYVKHKTNLDLVLKAKSLRSTIEELKGCQDTAWEQVFLTVYANIYADPVKTLSYLEMAQSALPFNRFWKSKVAKIYQ